MLGTLIKPFHGEARPRQTGTAGGAKFRPPSTAVPCYHGLSERSVQEGLP